MGNWRNPPVTLPAGGEQPMTQHSRARSTTLAFTAVHGGWLHWLIRRAPAQADGSSKTDFKHARGNTKCSGGLRGDQPVSEPAETEGCRVRVVTIYSLPWHYRGKSSRDLPKELGLSGALRHHYDLYREQLPRLLPDEFIGGSEMAESIELDKPVPGITVTRTNSMLFALPSNRVVLAVIFCFNTHTAYRLDDVEAISNVLEQTIDGNLVFKPKHAAEGNSTSKQISLASHANSLPHNQPGHKHWKRDKPGDSPLQPERHQLVFITPRFEGEKVPDDELINEIVYRHNPPYREEFGRPKAPDQLNLIEQRQKITLGVVTPYVSLLYGHQRYVEDSIFLSTVHAVGTASTFRQIWHDSYTEVRKFRESGQAKEAGIQSRAALEKLADNLGNLEFDLTFSVEFPLIRIEAFHTALYEAMDLSGQADALSKMFTQLSGSLRSEITAIDVRERRTEKSRQRWNAFATGVLSLIGVAVGFVIAFLGINTIEVPNDRQLSMWDPKFTMVYLVASLFAIIPVFFILFPYLRDWVNDAHSAETPDAYRASDTDEATDTNETAGAGKTHKRRPLWVGVSALLAGFALFFAAILIDRAAGKQIVIDAIMKSIGVFGLLMGFSLLGLHLWKARAGGSKARDEDRSGSGRPHEGSATP